MSLIWLESVCSKIDYEDKGSTRDHKRSWIYTE